MQKVQCVGEVLESYQSFRVWCGMQVQNGVT